MNEEDLPAAFASSSLSSASIDDVDVDVDEKEEIRWIILMIISFYFDETSIKFVDRCR